MPSLQSFSFDPKGFQQIRNAQYGTDWPVVYILENDKQAYIGQTVNAYRRLQQHYDVTERQQLTRAHVINDVEFNISATLDIESSLIQYIAADGKYNLQNGNGGLSNHSYFNRQLYQAKFEQIWNFLLEERFVSNHLLDLRNSDIFKYSPYKALTADQLKITHSLFQAIASGDEGTYLVHGEAGTGKTIVGIYLIKFMVEHPETKNLNIGLVVPMTSLRKTLQKVFKATSGLKPSMILGPSDIIGADYDLLIVDEAHRLRRRKSITNYRSHDEINQRLGLNNDGTELDWIIQSSKSQILLYDVNQSVRPSDIRTHKIHDLKPVEFRLRSQLRVEGGDDYINFVDSLLAGSTQHMFKADTYDFKIYDSVRSLKHDIEKLESKHGLCRMLAGYAWPWKSKKDVALIDFNLDGENFQWNSQLSDWVNSKNAINEVGCIHTVQGYDLNFAGVIIGPELSYDHHSKQMIIYPERYVDRNGRTGIEDQKELERYIINIYKTLMTRGIKGTYIYAVDPELKAYFQSLQ